MITFKTFLTESHGATAKWNTSRATSRDIKVAIKFVANHTSLPIEYIHNNLLGSTKLTIADLRKDSGDIDVAVKIGDYNPEQINTSLLSAVDGEGVWNKGTMVGSYAVPVGKNKKVQVDLMFVKNLEWANFAFHSSEGHKSDYKGAVRNILLATVARYTQVPGEDFVALDDEGNMLARASRSWKMDTGLERLFKITKVGPRGGKSEVKVSPEELKKYIKTLDKKFQNVDFKSEAEIIDNPDQVAEHLFGKGVKSKDVMTVEQVLKLINDDKYVSASKRAKIMKDAKEALSKSGFNLPKELTK